MTDKPMRAMLGFGCRASPRPGFVTLLALALGASACDLPTAAPEWDQQWIVPAEETTVEVSEFLPDNVTLAAEGSAFSIQVDPIAFSESLGGLCAACVNGGPVPKPAFQETFQEVFTLPSDVSSATVSQGSITVSIFNGFGFDPIQPGGATDGTITLRLYDGPAVGIPLDSVLIDGATEALAPGSTVMKTLDIVSATVGTTLTVELLVDSPAGADVMIDTAELLQVTAIPGEILVSSATVNVANQDVSFDQENLDVEDIDQEVVDHIRSGAFVFEIQNPFGIGVLFTITISGDGFSDIVKTLEVTGAATDTVRIEFSQAELKSFMGQPNVTLSGEGTVSGTAGAITVSPGQVLTIDSKLDIVLIIGGGD